MFTLILLLRLLLFAAGLCAAGLVLARLWQLYDAFDPAHWGDFLRQNFAGPLVTLLTVCLLWLVQEPIALWLFVGKE
ncbi:MAG: hypothetical protein LAT55_06420 [Opitutales bacterium]|nr:hypothetical protein [Opitutales bacterium]